jgi:hypothetical protein
MGHHSMKASRNLKPLRAAKFNQTQGDGEMNDTLGPAFAPNLVNASHEFPEG